MTKILHIIEALGDFGGTPRKLLYLAEQQEKHDIQNYFFCYRPSEITEKFESLGCQVINAGTLRHDKLIYSLYKATKKIKPDVICTHFTRPLIIGSTISRLLGIPHVHSEHCSPDYRKGASSWFSAISMRTSRKVICNSKFTQAHFDKKYQREAKKTVVVYNPVKTRKVSHDYNIKEKYTISEDDFVIGHVGGLVPWRDHITLLRAFTLTLDIHRNCKLIIVGDGPCRQELEEYIVKHRLQDKVFLVGYSNDIGNFLDIFDVFVNPAIEEGFGIAVVEAMLAARPVVLANAGAHPELIQQDKTGFLYKKKDPESLFEKLTLLAQNPTKRDLIGQHAKSHASDLFSLENYANNYYSEVKSAIS